LYNPVLGRDGWVVGFTPSIATVVWTGNNDNRSMTAAGAGISAAGPMWHEFMAKAIAALPREQFPQPEPVSSSKIMLNGSNAYTPPNGGPTQYHEILYYVGSGTWYKAKMTKVPGEWQLVSSADKGVEKTSNKIMFATFNGSVASLWEMMQDLYVMD